MPLVVVEIGDHAAPAALSSAMVQACSSSFSQGSCALSETLTDTRDEPPVAVATVKWGDAGERSVEIEVGTKRRGEAQWLSKTLHFRAVDPRAERWRSVGLTIATLVRELAPSAETALREAASEAPPGAARAGSETSGDAASASSSREEKGSGREEPVATPNQPSTDQPAPDDRLDDHADDAPGSRRAPRRSSRTAVWLEAGPRGGPAFGEGSLRAGGFVAVGFYPLSSPVFARVALGHEGVVSGPAALSATFTSLTLGGGAALRLRDTAFVFEPRAAFLMERLSVSLTDEQGRTDDASVWVAGAQIGGGLVWELGPVCPVVGLDALWRGQPTDIAHTNSVLATVSAVDWSAHAAVRIFL